MNMAAPVKLDDSVLQRLLSTCERCQHLRRRCDTRLPACRSCEKANVECMIFDHALQELLPRTYIQELLRRRKLLQEIQDLQQSPLEGASDKLFPTSEQLPGVSLRDSSDLQFHLESPHGTITRFFGRGSMVALMAEVWSYAHERGILTGEDTAPASSIDHSLSDQSTMNQLRNISLEPESQVSTWFDRFLAVENVMYRILDASTAHTDLDAYLHLRLEAAGSSQLFTGENASHFFRASMICAISCANQALYEPRFVSLSLEYFAAAEPYVASITSEVSDEAFQAIMLLTIFCLLHPQKGNIWILLGLACRLSLELGYHASPQAVREPPIRKISLHPTFWGLYALESLTTQLLGRVSGLPDTAMTMIYATNEPEVSEPSQSRPFPGVIENQFYLPLLCSKIYKTIYVPADVPNISRQWLTDQHQGLERWRQTYERNENNEDTLGIQNRIYYHYAVILLFQSTLMKALRRSSGEEATFFVPHESYEASVSLINIYGDMIRKFDRGTMPEFPVTFISGLQISLAGLTLMVYCLLRLDELAKGTCKANFNGHHDSTNNQYFQVDFRRIVEAAGSCLVLLSWCCDRWPDTTGVFYVYKRLYDRVIPNLTTQIGP